MTYDPDGNNVFFDTSEEELGEDFRRKRIAGILADTEHDLREAGASAECLQALRDRVMNPFGS